MIESNVLKQRREKALDLQTEGLNLYPNSFRPRTGISELHARFGQADAADLEQVEEVFHLAGRIMARRDYGKSIFFDIQDHSGRIQAYIRKQDVKSETFDLFKKLDIGDIVGLDGRIFRTKTRELTLLVSSLELITKSLLPLPEKYHEINVELKYRQRYVDLIMNEKTREVFIKRTRIISLIRRFLEDRSFIEVETPMMQPIPGGATARPFETFHQTLNMKLFLRVAPELYLKRLLVGGFNRVYELNRNFRNEGISTQHNPEFTMLEFYQTYATYEDMMDLTEEMIIYIAREINGSETVTYQNQSVALKPPWTRLGFHQALKEVGGVPSEVLEDRERAMSFCDRMKIERSKDEVHGKLLAKIFDVLVEPKLINPTFITGYPTDISPLARRNQSDPSITDRFELFIVGREMANGFSELNDPLDQRERFLAQVAEREAGDDEAQFMDEDYVRALMYGMPPAGGEGVGIDRLVMLFTDCASIRDVILFPHLRPE
ncbi:MAG: lysine--tRNA ligase [Deltaproteobacteria bacterium]|nr:lysine--tRNA ligase [Deltaproteobacteria bacterium]